ncbi:Rrf2 family transcriptional regulator [Lentisphaerota bacterium ZTH]|nr:Rrf2 family transcriptional regulator [Lentisphaerota bacterium]WET07287.1 Rrf2 family transcriptional regulator [Lentisphaerota bacterium ZTH]
MKLTVKTRCGLRVLLELARAADEKICLKGWVLTESLEISESFLEQLMIPLRRGGLVKTRRGCNGGYYLGEVPESISLLKVIELFEGDIGGFGCSDEICDKFDTCAAAAGISSLAANFTVQADNINLAQLLKPVSGDSEN